MGYRVSGIENISAFVRSIDRDTAVIALVDSNLHREHVLTLEKAFAYFKEYLGTF